MLSTSLSLLLLAGFSLAQEEPEPIELYPIENGRMYKIERERLIDAVDETLDELGLSVVDENEHGLRTTPLRKIPKRRAETMGLERRTQAAYYLWMPETADLARLYIGAVVIIDDTTYFNYGPVERWLFGEIEKRLDSPAMAIPIKSHVRGEAIAEMLGVEASRSCLALFDKPHQDWKTDPPPQLIEETKIMPIFPESGRKKDQQAELFLSAVIAEDGTIHEMSVLRTNSPNPEFIAATLGAVRLWRYRPGKVDGCAVPAVTPLLIEFQLH